MKKIALVTDSASSLTVKSAPTYDVYLLKMPIIIGEDSYYEDIDLTYDQFIEQLRKKALPKTSQPSIGEAEELFDRLVTEYEHVIVMPISKALSSTYQMLSDLATRYQDKIYVADHRVASGNQLEAVMAMKERIDRGDSFSAIVHFLEEHKNPSSVYLAPFDISHLKRTGRTSATNAFIASVLRLHPILALQGEENFKMVGKVLGFRKALKEMVRRHQQDGVTNLTHNFVIMEIDNRQAAEEARQEILRVFGAETRISIYPISPVIASHTGLKTVAICANIKY